MSTDRGELYRRREALQARIREAAAREAERQAIAGVAADLEAAGVAFEVIPPGAAGDVGWAWIERRFPLAFARVDWDRVPGAVRLRCHSDAERDEAFRAALLGRADPAGAVVVVWGHAGRPPVKLAAGDAATHCTCLLDADFDLWIYDPAGDWLIESYHEGELCTGTVQRDHRTE